MCIAGNPVKRGKSQKNFKSTFHVRQKQIMWQTGRCRRESEVLQGDLQQKKKRRLPKHWSRRATQCRDNAYNRCIPQSRSKWTRHSLGMTQTRNSSWMCWTRKRVKCWQTQTKVLQHVHDSYQQQARPASRAQKANDFLPNATNREYPWRTGAYNKLDPSTLETAAEKHEYGHMSMLQHV